MIQTVLILCSLWSGLSIGRVLILLGKITRIREKVPSGELDSMNAFAGKSK